MRRAGAALLLLLLAGCSQRQVGDPGALAQRRLVWEAVQPMAEARGIDPLFAYALVGAESGFDPRARRGEARGLLQIKPQAWAAASAIPYEPGVWDPMSNLAVGLDRLAAAKRALESRGVFSYPLLWAAHHYGLDYVAARGFDMSRIPRPPGRVAIRLWSGDARPLDPPR